MEKVNIFPTDLANKKIMHNSTIHTVIQEECLSATPGGAPLLVHPSYAGMPQYANMPARQIIKSEPTENISIGIALYQS